MQTLKTKKKSMENRMSDTGIQLGRQVDSVKEKSRKRKQKRSKKGETMEDIGNEKT